MGFEEVDIDGEEPESIDDLAEDAPDGWHKSELVLISYSKDYAHDLHAEITIVCTDKEEGPYVVNNSVTDTETEKKLSESSYFAETKESMEEFVEKMFKIYDKVFPERD